MLSVVNEPLGFGAIPFCLLCVKPESPTAIFVQQKETQRKRIRYQLVEGVLKPLATVMKSIQQEAASSEVSANETVYTKMFDPTLEGLMCNIL